MAVITVPGMFLTGDHASRPAANTVGSGSIYSCTDHALLYQSDGSSWTTWATLGGDISSHTGDATDAHDASAISVLDTAANFTGTEVEAVLAELQDNIDAVGAGGGVGSISVAVLGSHSQVSSTSFANSGLSFALEASSRYLFEFFLDTDTNATSVGIKLAVNAGDAGTSVAMSGLVPTGAPAAATPLAGGMTFTKDAQPFVTTTGSGTTRSGVLLWGWTVTTTNPDTLHLRHASETATQTSIYAGSVGRLTKLA